VTGNAMSDAARPDPRIAGRRLMWIVWPAFLVAAVAELVFFSIFDPFDLHFFGAPLDLSRQAIYTMGFFGFWGLGIASSALTVFLARSSSDPDGPAPGGDRRATPSPDVQRD
jgi:hypothetical protein